ncbi:hypothetical protein EfmAA610_25990 [Enterococcus faecium]|nr:hypothetical protein EfmAA610_25990 [Enterococcus faecium]
MEDLNAANVEAAMRMVEGQKSRKMKKVRRPKNTKKPSKRMIHYLRKEKFQGSACPLRSSAAC